MGRKATDRRRRRFAGCDPPERSTTVQGSRTEDAMVETFLVGGAVLRELVETSALAGRNPRFRAPRRFALRHEALRPARSRSLGGPFSRGTTCPIARCPSTRARTPSRSRPHPASHRTRPRRSAFTSTRPRANPETPHDDPRPHDRARDRSRLSQGEPILGDAHWKNLFSKQELREILEPRRSAEPARPWP